MNKKPFSMTSEDEVKRLIGSRSDESCPTCGEPLWENGYLDFWCSECGYSTDPSISESIKDLLRNEDRLIQIPFDDIGVGDQFLTNMSSVPYYKVSERYIQVCGSVSPELVLVKESMRFYEKP